MKYVVDRIIDDVVVLENISTGEIVNRKIDDFPKNIHEGSILIYDNNVFILDLNEERVRKKGLRERLDRLKKLKK